MKITMPSFLAVVAPDFLYGFRGGSLCLGCLYSALRTFKKMSIALIKEWGMG